MRLPERLVNRLMLIGVRAIMDRPADFVIGGSERPYIKRWFVIPRNRWFNVYFHTIHRDDDDRALHDHPWLNASILLCGSYIEHTIAAGGIHVRTRRAPGDVVARRAIAAHRLEVERGPVWTLFITGPRFRDWGFHCPERGWVHWREFTDPNDSGLIGPGCGDDDKAETNG